MNDGLRSVQNALNQGDKATARQLLQPILRNNPTANAWVLAAFAAEAPNEVMHNLAHALQLDPDHPQANKMAREFEDMGFTLPDVTPQFTSQAASSYEDDPFNTGDESYNDPFNEPETPAERPQQASRPSSSNTYQMLWDCGVCGTEKLLGVTHRHCPNCGTSQQPEWRYFPSDEEKIAVEDHHFVGADVTCPACETLNSGDATFCQNCGSPLDEAEAASRLEAQRRSAGESFASSGPRDAVKEQFDAEMERVGVKKKNDSNQIDWRIIAGLGVVAVVLVGFLIALVWTREAQVTATGHSWERTIYIDEYRNFTTRDWRDSRPAGDNVSIQFGSCTREIREYEQVPDGQECSTVRVDNGDGTFSERQECRTKYRREPVYDDMCTWTGQRWEDARTVPTQGNSLSPAPYWGTFNLNCENQRTVGCEREDRRTEYYRVQFDNDDGSETYLCDFEQAAWSNIAVGSKWRVQVRVLDSNAADCNSLKPVN